VLTLSTSTSSNVSRFARSKQVHRAQRLEYIEDLIYRLRKRAEIRRQITTRKSVQNNEPDRIADLLEEAATELDRLRDAEEQAWEISMGDDL
jgi:ribosome maturation protein Sdo1